MDLRWHRGLAWLPLVTLATSAITLCAGCRRSGTTPTVVPESRSIDASTARDAAQDAGLADRSDALVESGADADASVVIDYFSLRDSAFVVSAQHDLAMREPPAATVASQRSGRAPTLSAAVALLRTQRASEARFVPEGAFSALGDGRFALITRRVDRGFRASPAFELHVFSENNGAAQLEGSAQAPTANLYVGVGGSTGCAPAVLAREVRDIDNDQEPELLFVLRYCLMASCISGYRAFEYTFVYDLTPGPRLALLLERRIRGQAHEQDTRSRALTWRDVNGDGHPDAIARGRDCVANIDRWMRYVRGVPGSTDEVELMSCQRPEAACADNPHALRDCVERDETALYDPATDAWRAGTDGAEPLPDRDCSGQPLSESTREISGETTNEP